MRAYVATVVGVAACLAQVATARAQGGRVLEEIQCPVDEPMGLEVRGDHLWISDMTTRTISEVDRKSGEVIQRIPTSGLQPTGLAWHGDTLFAADRWFDRIERRRPSLSSDGSPIPYYEKWAMGMTHDGEHLWVVDARSAKLHEIDPEDGTTIATFPAPAEKPIGIAFDGEYLWVSDHRTDQLYRVERKQGRVVTVLPAPGPYPSALAVDGDSLWVADYQTRRLYRVALPDDTPYFEDQPRKVHVSFESLYRPKGEGSLVGLTVYLAIPREIPGQHLQGELSFDPEPTRFATDRWGQKVAIFEVGDIPAGELRTVRWEGNFTLYRVRFHLVPERVDAAPMPGNMEAYLADDKKYDLDSKTVTELVEKLTGEETSYYWRARAIYQHLTDVIQYDRSSGWNNAATVLERGTGSCSEYTFALVALLRRAGIPARYVGAVSERDGDASFDDVFHRWAEVYMPGYGWVPVDANAGQGKPPGERGDYFGGRSNRHVVTTIGGGASDYLDWEYNRFETYDMRGRVELETQSISRYRPLESQPTAQEAAPPAPAPLLAESPEGRNPPAPSGGPRHIAAGVIDKRAPRLGPQGAEESETKRPLAVGIGLVLVGLLGLLAVSRRRVID